MIRIKSKREGFRRCGMAHPKKPTHYPDDRFTKEEQEILEAEPMLIVEHLEDDSMIIAKTAPLDEMTVPDLKKLLKKLDVDFDAKANKPDLIALVKKNTIEPKEV